jgi:hypothetical protein
MILRSRYEEAATMEPRNPTAKELADAAIENAILDAAFENGELYLDEDNTYPYDEGMYSE